MSTDLESLISSYKNWKESAKGLGRIPTHLKRQVIKLASEYGPEHLSQHLSLKAATVKQWQREAHITENAGSFNRTDFVTLATHPKPTLPIPGSGMPTVTFELPNGVKLFFSGQTSSELVEFACNFAKRIAV